MFRWEEHKKKTRVKYKYLVFVLFYGWHWFCFIVNTWAIFHPKEMWEFRIILLAYTVFSHAISISFDKHDFDQIHKLLEQFDCKSSSTWSFTTFYARCIEMNWNLYQFLQADTSSWFYTYCNNDLQQIITHKNFFFNIWPEDFCFLQKIWHYTANFQCNSNNLILQSSLKLSLTYHSKYEFQCL